MRLIFSPFFILNNTCCLVSGTLLLVQSQSQLPDQKKKNEHSSSLNVIYFWDTSLGRIATDFTILYRNFTETERKLYSKEFILSLIYASSLEKSAVLFAWFYALSKINEYYDSNNSENKIYFLFKLSLRSSLNHSMLVKSICLLTSHEHCQFYDYGKQCFVQRTPNKVKWCITTMNYNMRLCTYWRSYRRSQEPFLGTAG